MNPKKIEKHHDTTININQIVNGDKENNIEDNNSDRVRFMHHCYCIEDRDGWTFYKYDLCPKIVT